MQQTPSSHPLSSKLLCERKENLAKEMSDLFRVCLYFEEEVLKQLVKGAESFLFIY